MNKFNAFLCVVAFVALVSCLAAGGSSTTEQPPSSPPLLDVDSTPHAVVHYEFRRSGYGNQDAADLADRAFDRAAGIPVEPFIRTQPIVDGAVLLDPDTHVHAILFEAFRRSGHPAQHAADLAEVLLERRKGNSITVEDIENERKVMGLE